jgi:hypothetical protein
MPKIYGKDLADYARLSAMSISEYQATKIQEIEDAGNTIFNIAAMGGGDTREYFIKVFYFKETSW